MPPVATGSVTGAIAVPLIHSWAAIVPPPNDGAVSGSATSIMKFNVAVSPSASVTVYVYVVTPCVAVGVPQTCRDEG